MKKGEMVKLIVLRTIGNFLVLFAVFGFFATFGPAVYYEITYRIGKIRGINYAVADVATVEDEVNKPSPDSIGTSLFGALLRKETEHLLVPVSTDFSLVIPKIGANHNVFENVDPSNESEYLPILQKGVAHAKGTLFPGEGGTVYLFAHSTDSFWNVGRYNAVFYLLKELDAGDEIAVFFRGRRYNYLVSERRIEEASNVQYLSPNIDKGEFLVLQTCWPPGTTWKRLFVLARPKS